MSNKRPDIEGEMDELQRAVQDLSRDENIEISVEQLVKAFNNSKEETLTNDIWGKFLSVLSLFEWHKKFTFFD
jgi:hypothetical protein